MRLSTTQIRDEALSLGYLGNAALAMMRGVFREQLLRFPGLDDADEVDDLVNDFFEAKGAGYANAVTALPDDAAARRLTYTWVEHWLVDRVRQRPWGALRNRLEKRLQRSSLFTPSALAHHWILTNGDDIDLPVEEDELRAIAASAPVEVAPSMGDGPVRLGRTGQLEEMLRRVLAAAADCTSQILQRSAPTVSHRCWSPMMPLMRRRKWIGRSSKRQCPGPTTLRLQRRSAATNTLRPNFCRR